MARRVKQSVLDSMPYLEKYKKKKEEEEQKPSSPRTTSNTDSKPTTRRVKQEVLDRMPYLEKYTRKDEDIAPVRENVQSRMTVKDEEKRKWYEGYFQRGALDKEDGVAKTILGTASDVLSDIGTGIVGIGESVVDALAMIAPSLYDAQVQQATEGMMPMEQRKLHEEVTREMKQKNAEWVKKDLYDEEKVAKQILAGIYSAADIAQTTQNGGQVTQEQIEYAREAKQAAQEYLETEMESDSVLGEKSDSIAQSLGHRLASTALQAVGVPWWATYGVTTFGSETENALKNDATYEEAIGSGLISAGAEIFSESLFAGSGLGEKGLINLAPITAGVSNKAAKAVWDYLVDVGAEGAEEVFSQIMGRLGSALYKEEKLSEILLSEEAFDEYIQSFISGSAMSGIMNAPKVVTNAVTGTDSRYDLSQAEQKVVDKVYKDTLAEREKDGKLTNRQKSALMEEVIRDMEKGRISVDTIEEVLGGESYERYRNAAEWENSLQTEFDTLSKEYDTLYNMKNGDKSSKQADREAELKNRLPQLEKQLKNVKATSGLGDMKLNLSQEVFDLTKDTRLVESYLEGDRKGQTFEADVTKYDTKQRETIQRAIDSGILNNTNRTHEFVDLIAKISADKGVLFDFTNNERLKTSGFAVEGKQVNGFVTKDGKVTLNINSAKALNKVAGHEITHVLEGTELYKTLQEAVFNYDISKNGLEHFNQRMQATEALYKGMEADIEKEITADLVGEYIFTDTEFVRNLSTENRNIFEKIFDEIKYLCKVVTAGSKEARELEKVKKAFEDAYRENGKRKDSGKDATYSLGYHAGDLGKAESYGQQGGSRSTGHFGTGTYFVGDEAKISKDSVYGNRPHHAVEFDSYKLYKVRNDKKGYKLHENLHAIDAGFTQEHLDAVIADKMSASTLRHDAFERGEQYDTKVWDEELEMEMSQDYFGSQVRAMTEVAEENGVEFLNYDEWLAEQTDDVPKPGDDDYDTYKYDYHDYLKDLLTEADEERNRGYDAIRNAHWELKWDFGEDNVNRAMQAVLDHDAAMEQADYKTRSVSDSRATVFMKALGYEGIDVRGTGLDNTTYGSVIYDLKGEDLARKQEIGTAKYSVSDSTGRELSKEQQEFFRDSKMRDENGSLKVMYHGTQDAGFHVFDNKWSDDDTSFFFVDRNDVATSYSGTEEVYEARTVRSVEDMNNFLAEIGYDHYEAVERNGKVELLENNEHVATKDTAQEIYEEFCWYEGVGDGDANYKVYLNLKNPLEVDAKGRPWNKIDAEFSQDVYDRYQTLTAEEKDALIDLAEWEDFSLFNSEIQLAEGNELASAYEKLGEYVNKYDLFSIASDSFSEESLREYSRNFLKTRDYAQRAKEQGYDGVIFRNIVDNGGYSNGSEGASTVAIAFDANQIKSTANEKPTGNPDIRYSISDSEGRELTNEQVAYFQDSKVRDENGNLKVMYHGTPNGDFTIFKDGTYFTDNREYADIYQNPGASSISTGKVASNPKTFEVYLDIKKPFDISDPEARDIYINDYIKGGNAMGINPYLSDAEYAKIQTIDWTEGEDLREFLIDNGYDYDGLVLDEGGTGGYVDEVKRRGNSYVVFSPEQVKNVDNLNPTSDPDIRFSLSDNSSYAEIEDERQKLRQREIDLEKRKRVAANNPELLQAMDDYSSLFAEMRSLLSKRRQGTATQAELDRIEEIKVLREERMSRVTELQESLGLTAIAKEETEIRETKEALRVAADAAWAREGAERENKAIEKAGISASEYFRKKAIKAFKTTTNFNEAGYLLPDGKLLNFSGGERNHRYRDHREIGEIYEATQGVAALNRFMSDGNIRIMAESPGIDLTSGIEPTKEQYAALRRFINANGAKDGQFFVDFSGTDGRNVGKYAYNGRIIADRIVNDIKYFYQTGKVRESSGLLDFLSLSNIGESESDRRGNFYGSDMALPVAENATTAEESSVAPAVAENATVSEMETIEFPDDLAPVESELEDLLDEESEMRSVMESYGGVGDIEAVNKLIPEYEAIRERIRELQQPVRERVESIGDADAPGEKEAPVFMQSKNYDPFEGVDVTDISRSTRSYSDRNPGARHFLEEAALGFGYDVANSTHGEKWYNDELYYASGGEKGFGGTSRHTTSDIADLKDTYGYTWDQLLKAAEDVAKGEFRSVAAKRVEYLCHKRLVEGYTDVDGRRYEPSQEYISFLNETFANEQRTGSLDDLLENADQYAPEEVIEPMEEIAPVKPLAPATPDTIKTPVYNSKDPGAVKGQTSLFEPPKPNHQVATVLTKEAAIAKEKSGIGGKLVSALVDKGMVFENLSHKTGNMELQSKYNYALPSNTEARAQYLMENGAKGVKSLKSIMKSAEKTGKANDFSYYLYHVHNIDRMTLEDRFDNVPNKTVFGETVTADVSRAEVAKLLKANPEFKAMAEDVYAYNRHLRQLMVDSGVISQETANLWEKMYPHYVPVRRVDSNGVNVSVPLDTRKTGVNNPVKKAIGGSSDILPLFNTMAQRTEQVYRAIARNSFGIELKNTLGTALETQQDTSVDGAIDNVVAQDELLKPGTMSNSPTFTVFENGERVEFEITEDMYDALKPAGKLLGYRNKALQKVGDARRNLLTVWNPVFALYRNPVKDIQDVAINSQHPVKTYANVPNAIFQMATGGKWAEEYHQNGGKSNTYFDSRTNQFKADDNFFKKVFGMPVRAVETAGEFIEEIPRLAEYIASRKNGRSVERSMLDSARVTTNFAAGGDFTKFLNSHGFTFLNASVQGASQHVRNFREAKEQGLKGYVKVLAKYTVAGLPGILLNSMLWDDDEEYEELSDYVKQNYYVVAKTEDGKFVRIPKGRTAAVMQNLMEQMQNLVTGDDEADFQTFFELFMNNIAPNNPIENNILAPIGQALKNEAWYGGDLVPSRLQNLPAEEQYDESTDSISRWLGEKTGLSPYKINYLLDQYSGGLGDVFLPMFTPEAESGDDSLMGNFLAPWKKEFSTDSVLNNKNPGDFYDLRDELEKISNSSNATEEDSMRTMYMDSVSWEMSDLYKQKREIQSGDLPDSEKYEQVREIQEQINELAKNAMEGYNDVSINGLYSEVGDRRYNKDADSGKWYEIRAKNSDGSDNYYYQQEQKVTKGLGITPTQYWNNREEYNFAYDKPEQYALAQSVGGYQSYRSYTSELWDIKADKDENGKSINGSRKEKVIDWINNLDADYGTKIILFKNEYNADDTYNYDILDYLNSRSDLSYDQTVTILKYLGFTVDKEGNVYWD